MPIGRWLNGPVGTPILFLGLPHCGSVPDRYRTDLRIRSCRSRGRIFRNPSYAAVARAVSFSLHSDRAALTFSERGKFHAQFWQISGAVHSIQCERYA